MDKRPLRLICAEPDPLAQGRIEALGRDQGWEVQSCRTALAVTRALSSGMVDLVVTAPRLEGEDYILLIQQIRARTDSRAIPVVLLVEGSDHGEAERALVEGVTEVFFRRDLSALRDYLGTFSHAEQLPTLEGRRALLVEDDEVIARTLVRQLGELGLHVDLANTVEHALSLVHQHHYDLFISDLVLQGTQSGNLLIRALRQAGSPTVGSPIIAISGFEDEARKQDALRAGANHFLEKPVSEMALRFLVRNLLADLPALNPGEPPGRFPSRYGLSDREGEICNLVLTGRSDKKIAQRLGISYWTVRTHMSHIFRKCGVVNRIELAAALRAPQSAGGTPALPEEAPPGRRESLPQGAPTLPQFPGAEVVDHLKQGIIVTDLEHRILYVNRAYCEITGFTPGELLGETPRVLRSGKHEQEFYEALRNKLATQGAWEGEVWNRHKNGSLFLEWLSIRRLEPEAGRPACYLAEISDITERCLQEERIRHSALHDTLTGLANRTLLRDRAELALAQAGQENGQVGILFIDLDRFKVINDALGHDMGDAALREVTTRIRSLFQGQDTLARFGGDEFVALLPGCADPPGIMALAQRILEALRQPFRLKGQEYRLGASIGVATYPDDAQEFDPLLACADIAMYRAKAGGGNRVECYDVAMQFNMADQLALENRLHQALEAQEFKLCYQPKVTIANGRIHGAEALIRWHHPEKGLILPGDFIPAAEQSGLILRIGKWVLEEACRALARIHRAGFPDFTLAVNVSPIQVASNHFVAEVKAAVAAAGASLAHLQLEITESVFVREPEKTARILRELSEMGISLALDDFGKGYSTLGYLKNLPFDTIKVDREFIRDVHADLYNGAITQATLHIARGLRMNVVAEGVENAEQFHFLHALGCDSGQGFLFGHPVAEEELLRLLQETQPGQAQA